MAKYADFEDLAYLLTLIRDGFVVKDGSRTLSDNNFSDEEKKLLQAIAEGTYFTEDRTFVHKQMSASKEWMVVHDLGKLPSVTVVDSANNVVVGDVKYIDDNSLVITFTGAFSGKALLN